MLNQMFLPCPLEIFLLQNVHDSGKISTLQNCMGTLPTPKTKHKDVSPARKRRGNWKLRLGRFVVVYYFFPRRIWGFKDHIDAGNKVTVFCDVGELKLGDNVHIINTFKRPCIQERKILDSSIRNQQGTAVMLA